MVRIVGYVAFFLVSFVVCLYLTFPWGAVKERVLQQASRSSGALITARSLEPSWLTGVHAEGVEIALPGADEPLALERLDARASVLSFLSGGYGGSFRLPMAQGQIEADVAGSGASVDVEAEARGVELALVPGLRSASGLALAGTLNLDADVALGLERPEESQGTIELSATELETLKGGKVGSFPVPELALGNLAWTLPVEDGKVLVRNQRLSGPTVDLVLDGEVVLARPLSRSLVNLTVRFKPTPTFLDQEPMIGALLRNIDRYKGPDGFYTYQMSGTVKRPRLTPRRG